MSIPLGATRCLQQVCECAKCQQQTQWCCCAGVCQHCPLLHCCGLLPHVPREADRDVSLHQGHLPHSLLQGNDWLLLLNIRKKFYYNQLSDLNIIKQCSTSLSWKLGKKKILVPMWLPLHTLLESPHILTVLALPLPMHSQDLEMSQFTRDLCHMLSFKVRVGYSASDLAS